MNDDITEAEMARIVRNDYAVGGRTKNVERRQIVFDRWLAEHDRAVAEKARHATLQDIRLLGDRAIGDLLVSELGDST